MTPLVQANALHIPLRSGSVNLIVTSPPYFGQRRYAGGEAQIGAEPHPQAFLEALWAVTAECWRVLAPDGVMFVNLGDKRAGSSGPGTTSGLGTKPQGDRAEMTGSYTKSHFGRRKSKQMLPHRYIIGCEDGRADPDGVGWVVSDYVWDKRGGMPESVTDRCRDAHEYVFQLTKSERWFSAVDEVREPHVATTTGRDMNGWRPGPPDNRGVSVGKTHADGSSVGGFAVASGGRIPSSIWTMTPEPLIVPNDVSHAYDLPDHFAPYPQEIPRRVILGWSPSGVCCACGEGRRPVVVRNPVSGAEWAQSQHFDRMSQPTPNRRTPSTLGHTAEQHGSTIVGYACACTPRTSHKGQRGDWKGGREVMPEHGSDDFNLSGNAVPRRPGGFGTKVLSPTVPMIEYHFDDWIPPPTRKAVVLDPFSGTGTTVGVARTLGRIGIGLDLSFDYLRLARWRVERSGHFSKTEQRTHRENQGDLFASA